MIITFCNLDIRLLDISLDILSLSLVSLLLFFMCILGLYYKYSTLCIFSIQGKLIPNLFLW